MINSLIEYYKSNKNKVDIYGLIIVCALAGYMKNEFIGVFAILSLVLVGGIIIPFIIITTIKKIKKEAYSYGKYFWLLISMLILWTFVTYWFFNIKILLICYAIGIIFTIFIMIVYRK